MKLRVSPSWERIIEQYIHTKEIILVKEEKCPCTSYSQIFKGIKNMFLKIIVNKIFVLPVLFSSFRYSMLVWQSFWRKDSLLVWYAWEDFFFKSRNLYSLTWRERKQQYSNASLDLFPITHIYSYIYILHIHIRIYNTCGT